ncbi:MAG: Rid family hydrolase [Phenylobacterium sp.]
MIQRLAKSLTVALALGASTAQGAEIVRAPATGAVAISPAVNVPPGSDLVFLSGALPTIADRGQPGTTETQAADALGKLGSTLKGLGLGLGDVVKATVYLVGDPAKGGEIDFAGLNAAWSKVFGSAQQPNKPARTTVKVAGLVAPGALVEIDVIAARSH